MKSSKSGRQHSFLIQFTMTLRRRFVSPKQLEALAGSMLRSLGWNKAAVSIQLVGDRRMRTLNREFLRHDHTTDVLAFSQLEGRGVRPEIEGRPFLGDVVICLDAVERQAVEWGNTARYELYFCLCHGLLHLMGETDTTPALRKKMHDRQHAVLKKLGIRKG